MARVPDVDSVDRERLKQVAANFRTALRSKVGDEFMTFASRLNLERRTDTGGWIVEIATTEAQHPKGRRAPLTPQTPDVAIYLDRYLGGTERRLWAGFTSPTEAVIREVRESYPLPIGRAVNDGDHVGEPSRLKDPFTPEEVKYPHYESHPTAGYFFFGIFDLDGPPDARCFLARAVNFALQAIRALPDFRDCNEIELDFHDLEGVPFDKRQLAYSRSAELVRRFIAQRVSDKTLICDDCAFDPTTRLGDLTIHPRSLLDVHHKNPLHLLDGGRWNTLADLALLCPICHRLRHAIMRAAPGTPAPRNPAALA